ncbi:hypothetical protein WN943_024984 [Citrus x changshan-huyou]
MSGILDWIVMNLVITVGHLQIMKMKMFKLLPARYEANSGGFEFTPDGGNIVLKVGQLFKTIDEFRNVVKVFAIKNRFRLRRKGFFEGCRQFVDIDGYHLKDLYKEVLLSAVSINANHGIHPLAMCVVETENTDSWVYFMEKLYDQIGCNDGEGLCFMSDRQKGILLRKEFWAACGNQVELNNHMAEINSISPAAHRWLLQILVTCSVRGMPIVRMLEEIRRKIMILIQKRHELGKTWHDELPPLVRRRLIDARAASIVIVGSGLFQACLASMLYVALMQ